MKAPEIQAHAFVGALSYYVFSEALYGYRPAAPKAYVRAVVDTILRGATPACPGDGEAGKRRRTTGSGKKRTRAANRTKHT